MPLELPIPLHTLYAELAERAWLEAGERDLPAEGSFVAKEVKGRRYWYLQHREDGGGGARRAQRYVGPETPALLARIALHRQARAEGRQRRDMVQALRAAGLPGPDALTGRVLAAFEAAGVFRLRAVVVGTVAYGCYGGLLGERLSLSSVRTADLDIAQFPSVSVAVDDRIAAPDLGAVLREAVDPGFREVPAAPSARHPGEARATRYALGQRYRVEVLSPNRGPDTDDPVALPAIGADARPLRFLDFLIHREVQAVALHGPGVAVNLPAPERFAVHKMIVARRRPLAAAESGAKARKDLAQSAELVVALRRQRPHELAEAWREARARGPRWREALDEAEALLPPTARSALAEARRMGEGGAPRGQDT